MLEFLHGFENYDYDKSCEEILKLRKGKNESLEEFSLRLMHLSYIFHLDDIPSVSDTLLHVIYLSNEKYHLVNEESESCSLNVTLDVDLDSPKSSEDTNDLVGQHMFGPFFTLEDMYQREHDFLKEAYVFSHHSISLFFLSDDKEPSCVVNLSSVFSVADIKGGFPANNNMLHGTPMAMLGSNWTILSFSSWEIEGENVEEFEGSCHVPENLKATLGIDQFESNSCIHNCGVKNPSLSLTEDIQEQILGVSNLYHIANYLL
jgi:hypothetical protein